MKINLTIDLDPNGKTRNERYDIATALGKLGREDLAEAIRDELEAEREAEMAARIAADPKRTITPGIWRDRAGKVHEVKANDDDYLDGLPWKVDDYYTVTEDGYVYAGRTSHMDLLTQIL